MFACTVMNGTLAWDIEVKRDPYSCLDLDPVKLYKEVVEARQFLFLLSRSCAGLRYPTVRDKIDVVG